MSTKREASTFVFEKGKNKSFDIKSVISRYTYYTPVFLLSIAISLFIAFIYLKVTEPVYDIKATLLIHEDKNPQAESTSVLNKIDLPNASETIENEITKLKSVKMISQVISDLQLTTEYKEKKGFYYSDLYNDSPIKFTLIKGKVKSYHDQTLSINIKDEKSFTVETEDGKVKTIPFKTNITTPLGLWRVDANSNIKEFKNETIKITLIDPDKLTAIYQRKLDATMKDKLSSAIDITISDNIIDRGKDVLNHLIYVYNNAEVLEKNNETQNTINFIDKRLTTLTGELSSAEKNIENFKSNNQLTDISSDSKYKLDRLQINDANLNNINVQLSVIDGIERYINAPQNKGKVPSAAGVADLTLVSSIEKLSQLQLQYDRLLAVEPETNPDFDPIKRQIHTTREAIKENVRNIRASLINSKNQLQSVTSVVESSITSLPGQEREYISKKRQQLIKENLYVYLLQKKEEVSLSYASTVKNYRVIDNAYAGPIKWPSKATIYAAALMIGLILPIIIIYLKERIKNVILDIEDVESAIEVPILSEINYFKSKTPIVINENFSNIISEQFRDLRTKLHYSDQSAEKPKVLLLTSSIAGEGKSFISSNLGAAMAFAGKKTILLELDLRRSALSDAFKIGKDRLGVTDYLQNKSSLNEVIQNSGITPLLDIISKGALVTNPSELLENGRITELVAELKKVYDTIIIDSPPVHLVTDAVILSRVSDKTLYIIRQGLTPKSEIKFIKKIDAENILAPMQIIFNGVDVKKYGYGYHYDNSYYITKNKVAMV